MRNLISIILFLLFCKLAVAQLPGIPYQAIVLSSEQGQELPGVDGGYDNLLTNKVVSIQFTIYDAIQNIEYSEYHDSVLVDGYGMINLTVGDGFPIVSTFDQIDWDLTQKWLDVDIDFEAQYNFVDLDYIQLRIIPYNTDNQQLSLVDSILILENGSSVDLRPLLQFETNGDGSNTDNQNLEHATLNGTNLELTIEDGFGTSVDLNPLANDSVFINTLTGDSVFINQIYEHIYNTQVDEMTVAFNGQDQFITPFEISPTSIVRVYRNGVRIEFTIIDQNTIELEPEATCFEDDMIRIEQTY